MVKFTPLAVAAATVALPLLAIAAPRALDSGADAALARLAGEAMRRTETLHAMDAEAKARRTDRDAVDNAVKEAETVLAALVARERAETLEADAAQAEFENALIAMARAEIAPSAEATRAGGLAALAGTEAARRAGAAAAEAGRLGVERRERAAGRAALALEQARLDSASAGLGAARQNISDELASIRGAAARLAEGRRLRPVMGAIQRRFGERGKDGRSHGIVWRATPDSAVIAPASGVIAFAGPFRDYGQVLIIDIGGDYAVVLTGLGSLAAQAGVRVAAGQPLGRMAADALSAPVLYMEVRKGDRPVDPARWLSRRG